MRLEHLLSGVIFVELQSDPRIDKENLRLDFLGFAIKYIYSEKIDKELRTMRARQAE